MRRYRADPYTRLRTASSAQDSSVRISNLTVIRSVGHCTIQSPTTENRQCLCGLSLSIPSACRAIIDLESNRTESSCIAHSSRYVYDIARHHCILMNTLGPYDPRQPRSCSSFKPSTNSGMLAMLSKPAINIFSTSDSRFPYSYAPPRRKMHGQQLADSASFLRTYSPATRTRRDEVLQYTAETWAVDRRSF